MIYRICSWNVNGIRAAANKGYLEWLKNDAPDIVCLQETKAHPDQLTENIRNPAMYHSIWNLGDRKGYSGTALLSKPRPNSIKTDFDIPNLYHEGRIIIAEYDRFTLMNIYFPNGQQSDERLAYKMKFYDVFLEYVDRLKDSGKNLVICGDFNTAHKEIDLKNPKENENRSGFLPIERAWIDKFISHGYVDTFRHFHPNLPDQYTWWTYRFNARAKNIGWRIDYFFVNQEFLPAVKDSFILPDVTGSDHCPIGILLEI